MTNADIQEALRYGKRAVAALERIATALETGVANDPLMALQKALDHDPDMEPVGRLPGSIMTGSVAMVDPNADMPPHIKRALGLEVQS